MSLTDTNLCRNCGLAEETIEHLFFYCEKVTEFLSKIQTWIGVSSDITFNFKLEEVLLGKVERIDHSHSINILLLLLKHYIFEASRLGTNFNIPTFFGKIKRVYAEQEYLASINLQEQKFKKKWSFIYNLIQTYFISNDIH